MNISLNGKKITDIENKLVVDKGEEGWGGKDQEFGIGRWKLVYILYILAYILYNIYTSMYI